VLAEFIGIAKPLTFSEDQGFCYADYGWFISMKSLAVVKSS
jgi:hypothetical protein